MLGYDRRRDQQQKIEKQQHEETAHEHEIVTAHADAEEFPIRHQHSCRQHQCCSQTADRRSEIGESLTE